MPGSFPHKICMNRTNVYLDEPGDVETHNPTLPLYQWVAAPFHSPAKASLLAASDTAQLVETTPSDSAVAGSVLRPDVFCVWLLSRASKLAKKLNSKAFCTL